MPRIPDDCPEKHDEDCPVVEQAMQRRNRRSTDRLSSSATRIILALVGVIGAGSGGWLVRDRVAAPAAAAPPVELVDARARQDVAVLRAEIGGKLEAIKANQDQMAETLRELRRELRRGER